MGRGSASAAGLVCAALAGALCAAPSAMASWSPPARPAECAAALSPGPPLIVFPSSGPQARSGPGALLWTAPRECRGGAAGAGAAIGSPLGEDDLPGPGRPLAAGPGDPVGIAAATGTAFGQVLVAGPAREASGALVEGRVAGSLQPAGALGGPPAPVAAFSAFLGDALVVSLAPRPAGWDLAVRIQRHYSETPSAPRLLPAGPDRPSALAAAMDYRGDVLVVWARAGGVYARVLAESGALEPTQKLGDSAPDPELRASISDDGRAIVAWRSQTSVPAGDASTSIALDISGPRTRFDRPRIVERFRDPPGSAPSPGSLRLVRLSSEAVMIAWTGLDAGRYVVRASPVSLRRGAWAPVTISASGADAELDELVSGPRADALALWSTAPRLPSGALDPAQRAILAARGHYAGPGRVVFGAPEPIAPPGPNGAPTAAFDPRSDRALAAWVAFVGSRFPRIVYSLRGAAPAAAGSAPAPARSGTPARPLPIAAIAVAALLLLGVLARLAVARRPRGRIRHG